MRLWERLLYKPGCGMGVDHHKLKLFGGRSSAGTICLRDLHLASIRQQDMLWFSSLLEKERVGSLLLKNCHPRLRSW